MPRKTHRAPRSPEPPRTDSAHQASSAADRPTRTRRTKAVALSTPDPVAFTRASPASAASTLDDGPRDDLMLTQQICDRVKRLRAERGWSLEHLASLSGVSRSMLSQIERRQANPTLAVSYRIAQAFGLSLSEFVQSASSPSQIHVIRRDDPQQLYRSDQLVEIRTLSPLHLEKDVEFYQLRLQAGGVLKSAAHFQGTREFVTVEQGHVLARSNHDTVELHPGDSATYQADVEHELRNDTRHEAIVFLVVIYR
jgi:transcriptional regulator with XRE-family HTH domain